MPFPNALAEFVYVRTYAKYLEDERRRETWPETVERTLSFLKESAPQVEAGVWPQVRRMFLDHDVRPSSRLLQMAGEAARRNNISLYNCSYLPIDHPDAFPEIMYILMQGAGVGYSVERASTERLPAVQPPRGIKAFRHTIEDSSEGWADAFKLGVYCWYAGLDVEYDYALVRPAGARLKVKGGRASGPQALEGLLTYTREVMQAARGRKLTSLECHDIACKIGDIVVMGGVRRSALLSLSDLDDPTMRHAKDGEYWLVAPHRAMANNSVAYDRRPTRQEFDDEWANLTAAGTGERGIFNRAGKNPARRTRAVRGCNPCGEINLLDLEFCNLTEVVARAGDTAETLRRKVEVATFVGTVQSTLTNFPYLRASWKENCDEERLLGVSVTGQLDCPAFYQHPETMRDLRDHAVTVNRLWAKALGIAPSVAITTVKPSGNASQMVDCASGMHPRWSKYYARRVRVSATDPLYPLLRDAGMTLYPEVGQTAETATTWVCEFPVRSPDGAITRHDWSAIRQLEYWLLVKENYTEHNPSQTVYVSPDEWIAVGNWVYEHWDRVGGLSFLPKSDFVYDLAPYQELTEEAYHAMVAATPEIDYDLLSLYEQEDMTTGSQELACTAGACETI